MFPFHGSISTFLLCVVSSKKTSKQGLSTSVSDHVPVSLTHLQGEMAAISPFHYGTHASAHPHLGQPHHYRHHTDVKMMSIGSDISSADHSNTHKMPDKVDQFLKNKSDLRMVIENSINVSKTSKSNFSSASILDVDSFVPPGYDKLMPPKENGNFINFINYYITFII